MPLHVIEKVTPDRLMAIYRITESCDTLLESLNPDPEDRQYLDTFTNEQKKKEWLAGRITLRYLARARHLTYQGVIKDSSGKPYLRGNQVEVSLSHSFPYVAAVLDMTKDVGIDLEQPKEKLRRVAPRFLSEMELKDAGNDLRKMCILWCAKEALYKVYNRKGLIFRENIVISPFHRGDTGLLQSRIQFNGEVREYTLKYEDRGDFLIAFNQ